MSGTDIEALARLLEGCPSNWGKWGADDEVGALNYLDEQAVREALALARTGRVFTLGMSLTTPKGDPVFPGRWPARHFMVADHAGFRAGHWQPLPGGLEFADDYVTGFVQAGTHCDALGHMWYGDKLWNGYDACCTNGGMRKAGIEPVAERGIVGRCVLLDIARYRAKSALDRAETFNHEDLLACARGQGVDIAPRSILLVRTGWLGALADGRETIGQDYWEPGLTFSRDLVDWFDTMQIPCLVTDTLANETTYEPETGVMLPLHGALMRNLGIIFTESAWLDGLAGACAEDGRYEALFCASPMKITGGTGGSVNPVVIK